MKRFRNILIVCDDVDQLETVLARGLWLAEANGARVTLIDVLETKPGELPKRYAALSPGRAAEIEEEVLGHYRGRLDDLAAAFRDAGIETEALVAQGTAFLVVIRRVLANGHDLVLKGAKAGGPRGPFFASNDMHLLRKCPCPVWILQSRQPGRTRRILAAIDPDAGDDLRAALTRTVLELGTSLARRDGADLHVVHAWWLQEENVLRRGRFAMAEAAMAEFATEAPGAVVTVVKGAPGEAIPDYAEENGIDTIVMGTVGRTGISGFFIENTAETILSSVDCSVLTVKPPGFESPVEVADG